MLGAELLDDGIRGRGEGELLDPPLNPLPGPEPRRTRPLPEWLLSTPDTLLEEEGGLAQGFKLLLLLLEVSGVGFLGMTGLRGGGPKPKRVRGACWLDLSNKDRILVVDGV